METLLQDSLYAMRSDLAARIQPGDISFNTSRDAFMIVAAHLKMLKDSMAHLPSAFAGKAVQTFFFKEIQSGYLKEIMYYTRAMEIDRQRPSGSYAAQVLYYRDELHKLYQYVYRQRHLLAYYQAGLCYLDDILFSLPPGDITVYPADQRFSGTEHFNFFSYSLGKAQAYETLYHDLASLLMCMKHGQPSLKAEPVSICPVPETRREASEILQKIRWLEQPASSSTTLLINLERIRADRKQRRALIKIFLNGGDWGMQG